MLHDDTYFMKQAFAEAEKAYQAEEIPVGAIIVCDNQVIARAHNLTERLIDVTAHAEMQAITIAANTLGGKYLKECTMYVTLEPCIMCAGALAWSQIGRIVYAASDRKKGFTTLDSPILHPKTKITKGAMEEQASELIKTFFQERR